MKQNDTMKQRIAVYYSLLWILVKNRHKWTQNLFFTIELLWITWGDQHKERNLYRKITIAESKGGLKTQRELWTAEGYRHKTRNWIAVDLEWSSMVNTKHESRADSGLNQRKWKWNFFLKKGLDTKWLHTKIIAEVNQHNLNWMDTEKMKLLLLNFNARKRLI